MSSRLTGIFLPNPAKEFNINMRQATKRALDLIQPVPLVNRSNVEVDCTKPERPIQIYSYWGSPLNNVGEDGDYVLEEISGSLIGPKKNGKWPEDFVRIEGPVVGRRGCFPRWRGAEKRNGRTGGHWARWFKILLRFVLSSARPRLTATKH
jgi:hypothetical protein